MRNSKIQDSNNVIIPRGKLLGVHYHFVVDTHTFSASVMFLLVGLSDKLCGLTVHNTPQFDQLCTKCTPVHSPVHSFYFYTTATDLSGYRSVNLRLWCYPGDGDCMSKEMKNWISFISSCQWQWNMDTCWCLWAIVHFPESVVSREWNLPHTLSKAPIYGLHIFLPLLNTWESEGAFPPSFWAFALFHMAKLHWSSNRFYSTITAAITT